MVFSMIYGWLASQWKQLPYPTKDYSGQTVIVTGANTGLGLEAARHFARLGAARVILACRSREKGEAAQRDIETTTACPQGVVQVWELDLASFDSVRAFAARADAELERLDVLVDNASIATSWVALAEGMESTVTVNIVSTFLLTLMLLPRMRASATRWNVTPRIVVVSSDAAALAPFRESSADDIFAEMNKAPDMNYRYNTTKLIQLIATQQLAADLAASGQAHVLISAVNPNLCATELWRDAPLPIRVVLNLVVALIGRSAEVGSRCHLAAAAAGEESHGRYMKDCEVAEWPASMRGEEGEKRSKRVWSQLLALLERIEPGVTKAI